MTKLVTLKMQTFHNDPSIKQKYIERLELHRAHDEIVKGIYWENGKGCAVGCTIHGSDYTAYERELGIPRVIASLEDGIFEGLPSHIAKDFPLRFLNAVPVGVDLMISFYQFMHWLLVDKEDGVINFVKDSRLISSIKKIAELFEKKLAGENVTEKEWSHAGNAVYDSDVEDAYADDEAYVYAADSSIDDAMLALSVVDFYFSSPSFYAARAAYHAAYAPTATDFTTATVATVASAYYAASYYVNPIDALVEQARMKQADKLIELISAVMKKE